MSCGMHWFSNQSQLNTWRLQGRKQSKGHSVLEKCIVSPLVSTPALESKYIFNVE